MEGYADCMLHILYAAMEKLLSNLKWNVCFWAENASFLRKMLRLEQKRQKKTLDFYVNRIYTEKAEWSKVGRNPLI